MPTIYGTLMQTLKESPPADGAKLAAAQAGSKVRAFVETITLESGLTAASLLYCARIPANSRLINIEVTTDGSLGSTTIAPTDGTTTYGTAKVLTATDTPTPFIDTENIGLEFTVETDIYLLTAAATAPTSGIVKVVVTYADLN